jgi:hypothetical protein
VLSDVFLTHSGIKQGAPSSVILFIIFMDEFIDIVRDKCVRESVIGILHILLHADDTAVLSTTRELFITKCNILLAAFNSKRVSLNMKKSGFLVINPKKTGDRTDIKLNHGWLSYRSTFVYLGAIFSDNGAVFHDVNLHVAQREKSVYVKLANFMRNNPAAPITVKRKVLNSCLNTSLLYGSEAWGGVSLRRAETMYRKAIKITFSMNAKTPNEVIFLETGLIELKAEIYKRQYSFWGKILNSIDDDPESEVSKTFRMAIDKNVHYIRHYKNIYSSFDNAQSCYKFYTGSFSDKLKQDIVKKTAIYTHSILDDYIVINNTLVSPELYRRYTLPESDRQILTKYRCGSHFLKISTGRFNRTPVERRFCKCNHIQTLEHVLFHCVLTEPMRRGSFPTSLGEFFGDNILAAAKLRHMESLLKLRRC